MNRIHRFIDAAILKPETPRQEVIAALKTCVALETYAVCVRPCDISLARELCTGTTTAVCTVLDFPHGDGLTASKADAARRYLELGVAEIDMVANYGWARSGLWEDVHADIAAVTAICQPAGIPVKVIFETAQLAPDHIRRMVEISIAAGADFVKTSTGFYGEGAREEDVRLMVETAAGRIRVKASGGIRDRASAERFLALGVHRLGVNWATCRSLVG